MSEPNNILVQINDLLMLQPNEIQRAYEAILLTSSLKSEAPNTLHNELFAVLNFELILIDLQKKHIDKVSKEDMLKLLPWVRHEHRDEWQTLLNTDIEQSLLQNLLQKLRFLLESRKNCMLKQTNYTDIERTFFQAIKIIISISSSADLNFEAMKMTNYQAILNTVRNNHLGLTPMIEMLLNQLKNEKGQKHRFYEDLLAKNLDIEFNTLLFKVLRLELALSSINETLSMTPSKISKLLNMLDPDISSLYTSQIEKPQQVLKALISRLNQQKENLVHLQHKQGLKEKQEQEKIHQEQLQREQQEKEHQYQITTEQREQARQAPLQQVLQAIHFAKYIEKFEGKANKYKGNPEEKYTTAVKAANTLITSLINAKKEFLGSNQSIRANKTLFKKNCLKAIDASREVLEKHRGWKQLLANFFSVITSVITLGVLNYTSGKSMFALFPTKTSSQQHLDNFTRELNIKF